MEENEVYKEVLNEVSKLIVERNVDVSYCKDDSSFSIMLFIGKGDEKESVYNGYFTKKDSDKALVTKCEGFAAMVKHLDPQL